MANKTQSVLAQAQAALERNRKQLQTELDAVDRALAALGNLGGGRRRRASTRAGRRRRATPRMLAALAKARAARRKKRANAEKQSA